MTYIHPEFPKANIKMQGENNTSSIKQKMSFQPTATPGLPPPRVRFTGGSDMSQADSVKLSGQWER